MPSETYTIELDNDKGIYQFYRWELEHIAYSTEKGVAEKRGGNYYEKR
jgi:hypothetical protein